MSIRKQLLLVMSVLCVLLAGMQGFSTYFLYHDKLVSEYTSNISYYTKQNSRLFTFFTRKVEECLISLSNDVTLYQQVSMPVSNLTSDATTRSTAIKKLLINRIAVPLFNYASNYTYTFYASQSEAFSAALEGFSPGNITLSEQSVAGQPWFLRIGESGGRPLWFTKPDDPGYLFAGMEVRYNLNNVSIAHVGTILMRFPVHALLNFAERSWFTPGTVLVFMENNGQVLSMEELPEALARHLGRAPDMTFGALSDGNASPSSRVRIGNQEYIRGLSKLDMNWLMMTFTPVSDLRSRSSVFLSAIPLISFLVLIGVFLVSFILSRALSKPLRRLAGEISMAGGEFERGVSLEYAGGIDEVKILYTAYAQLLERVRAQMGEIYKKGLDVKQAELRALQAQINPHFLYNALDSISWAALDLGDSSIPRVISSLSKLLRYSIKEPSQLALLAEEMDIVRSYVEIQEFCYSLTIRLRWEGDTVPAFRVPKLTLQPIFENAILHGFVERGKSEGDIAVRSHSDPRGITIEVENEGEADIGRMLGILSESEDSGKNGIRNVHTRLRMLFGERSGLSFRNTGDGRFVASVRIERAREP